METTFLDAILASFAAASALFLLYGAWLCLWYGGENGAADEPHPLMRIAVGALAVVLVLGGTMASADGDVHDAMRDYERGAYAEARGKFQAAAERGDPRAQEILGLMYAFGPQLYPGVARDLRAAGVWLDRAARGGRPAARYAYCAIVRRERAPLASAFRCFDWVAETGGPR